MGSPPSMPEPHGDLEKCSLCSNAGAKLCSRCCSISYCGPECQKKDWGRHKGKCSPVVVREVEGEGRGLVAAKNIKTGDLIIKESAVIALPEDIGMWEAGAEITKQVLKANQEQKKEFYKLTYKQNLLNISESFKKAAGNDKEKE